jgi:hypothetical protein
VPLSSACRPRAVERGGRLLAEADRPDGHAGGSRGRSVAGSSGTAMPRPGSRHSTMAPHKSLHRLPRVRARERGRGHWCGGVLPPGHVPAPIGGGRVPGRQHFERLGDQLIRLGFDRKIGTDPRWTPETRPPLQLKSKRGKAFRSGPGATRTRDLLLRSAGRTVSRRQRAMRPSDLDDGALSGADRRWWGLSQGLAQSLGFTDRSSPSVFLGTGEAFLEGWAGGSSVQPGGRGCPAP